MRAPGRRQAAIFVAGVVCFAALALSSITTARAEATYKVEVKPDLDGLDIRIEPVAHAGVLVMRLTNASHQKVRCDLRYDASPQAIYRKSAYIDPGQTEQSDLRAKRKWFDVTVDVKCRAVDAGKE